MYFDPARAVVSGQTCSKYSSNQRLYRATMPLTGALKRIHASHVTLSYLLDPRPLLHSEEVRQGLHVT